MRLPLTAYASSAIISDAPHYLRQYAIADDEATITYAAAMIADDYHARCRCHTLLYFYFATPAS